MKELIFATNNNHKLEEVRAMLGQAFVIKSLADIGCDVDIPETGTTLQENAGIKSRYVFEHYQMNCFADDSGLEVDALRGEPGVYSARYSGSRDMDRNIAFLLEKMEHEGNRKARFRTVISLIIDGQEHLFEGAIEGQILSAITGGQGFGYDPIFIPDGHTKSFAEMSPEEKNAISHRAIAVGKLTKFLSSII